MNAKKAGDVILELCNQDDADRFVVVFDRFGAVFDRLGAVFDRKRRRNEAFEFDSNCQAPQRAWQFESNSNATEKMVLVAYS